MSVVPVSAPCVAARCSPVCAPPDRTLHNRATISLPSGQAATGWVKSTLAVSAGVIGASSNAARKALPNRHAGSPWSVRARRNSRTFAMTWRSPSTRPKEMPDPSQITYLFGDASGHRGELPIKQSQRLGNRDCFGAGHTMAILCAGIDLATNVFAVHGVNDHGKPAQLAGARRQRGTGRSEEPHQHRKPLGHCAGRQRGYRSLCSFR